MTLAVAHWRTTYVGPAPPDDTLRREWDEAPRRLAPAVPDTDGLVAIRALSIGIDAAAGDGAGELAARLERALSDAVTRALAAGPDGEALVRYPDRRDALADLLHRAAAGDLSRLWAFAALGLVPAEATSPAAFRTAAVAALAAEPILVLPVLLRLIAADGVTGSFTALVASLGLSHWDALLAASPATAPFASAIAPPPARPPQATTPVPGSAAYLLRWAALHPSPAVYRRSEIVRLLAGIIAPFAPATRATALETAAALFDEAVDHSATDATRSRRDLSAAPPSEARQTASLDEHVPRAVPGGSIEPASGGHPAPALTDVRRSAATEWGGLLFLLNLAGEAELEAHARAAALTPADALGNLARVIGSEDDPVVLALSPEPPESASSQANDLADAFEACLLACLGPPAPGERRWLEGVCRRPALLSVEPGWIEATFPLDTVDLRFRRAGLDLDPGFVRFLGAVVRFRYE